MRQDRRVVVTGLGAVSAAGANIDELWSHVRSGRSGTVGLPADLAADSGVAVAGIASGIPEDQPRSRRSRFQVLHLTAVEEALGSRLEDIRERNLRIGIYFGTSLGGAPELLGRTVTDGTAVFKDRMNPVKYLNHTPASAVAERFRINGPCVCFGSACAASTDAILAAATAVRAGQVDVAVASGAEAWLYQPTLLMFARLGALSRSSADDAATACRPFDTRRDGVVPAEGAAALVLEAADADGPSSRPVFAEVLGGASSCDAFHPVRPDPTGAALEDAYTRALADAGVRPGDVGYINCHGTATEAGDVVEADVANRVFGGDPPPMSSAKGVLGHTLGACGVLETVVTVLALHNRFLPPTANLAAQDPRCRIDALASGRAADAAVALKANSGFGGENTVLVLGRATG